METLYDVWEAKVKHGEPLEWLMGNYPGSTKELYDRLPDALVDAHRLADLKKLTLHKNKKLAQWSTTMLRHHHSHVRAIREQKKTESKFRGEIKRLCNIWKRVFWIAVTHYRQKSLYHPEANLFLTGDGAGMAYFRTHGTGARSTVKIVALNDTELIKRFASYKLKVGDTTNMKRVVDVIERYVTLHACMPLYAMRQTLTVKES